MNTFAPIAIIGTTGPSLPLSIRNARTRANQHIGKADPIWDIAFQTKFSRKPAEDAPLVTPKGAVKVITSFLDRVAEINWLAETQHQELATTMAEMKANNIAGFSLTSTPEQDMEAANIAENDVSRTHYAVAVTEDGETRYLDMNYAANMRRRIEWERYIYGCGPIHRVHFAPTKDGTLGIVYTGPDKEAEAILAHKRALKYGWLDRNGELPTIEAIEEGRAFAAHYGKPVLAHMTEAEFQTHRHSRLFGDEDPDPQRVAFHAEDLRGRDDRGYAGPHGALGLDDGDDDESFESDEEAEGMGE